MNWLDIKDPLPNRIVFEKPVYVSQKNFSSVSVMCFAVKLGRKSARKWMCSLKKWSSGLSSKQKCLPKFNCWKSPFRIPVKLETSQGQFDFFSIYHRMNILLLIFSAYEKGYHQDCHAPDWRAFQFVGGRIFIATFQVELEKTFCSQSKPHQRRSDS